MVVGNLIDIILTSYYISYVNHGKGEKMAEKEEKATPENIRRKNRKQPTKHVKKVKPKIIHPPKKKQGNEMVGFAKGVIFGAIAAGLAPVNDEEECSCAEAGTRTCTVHQKRKRGNNMKIRTITTLLTISLTLSLTIPLILVSGCDSDSSEYEHLEFITEDDMGRHIKYRNEIEQKLHQKIDLLYDYFGLERIYFEEECSPAQWIIRPKAPVVTWGELKVRISPAEGVE